MVSPADWTSQLVVSLESMGWILIMLTDRSLLLVLLDHTFDSVVHVVVEEVDHVTALSKVTHSEVC